MLNFSLKQPTLIKYLDPVFYAHNFGAVFLATGSATRRYPKWFEQKLLNQWAKYHGEDLTDLISDYDLDAKSKTEELTQTF
jgi:adenosylhomocysteinase